jgi:hypothetical protein
VAGFVLVAAAALRPGEAALAAERGDGGVDEEEGVAVDEDGDGDGLEAVGFEGFEFVELEGSSEGRCGEAVVVESMGVEGEPAEAVLDRTAGDAEKARGLTLSDASDEEVEERGIQVGFLVAVVGAEGLAGEAQAAGAAAEAWDGMRPAAGVVGAVVAEEAEVGVGMVRARGTWATRRLEHGASPREAREGDPRANSVPTAARPERPHRPHHDAV